MTAAEIALVLGDIRREGRDWRCRCRLPGGWSLAQTVARPRRLAEGSMH